MMNLKNRLIKKYENTPLQELPLSPVYALQGLSESDAKFLNKAFAVKTIQDLADLKFAHWAKELNELAVSVYQDPDMTPYTDKLIKKYEGKSPQQLLASPVYALQGLSRKDATLLQKAFYIKTVQDLAELKFFKWACEIIEEVHNETRKGKKDTRCGKVWLILIIIIAIIFAGWIIQKKWPEILSCISQKQEKMHNVQPAKLPEENKKVDTIVEDRAVAGEGLYIVKTKDKLTTISKDVYGSEKDWKKIFNANTEIIKNPDLIYPGQKLKIPKIK